MRYHEDTSACQYLCNLWSYIIVRAPELRVCVSYMCNHHNNIHDIYVYTNNDDAETLKWSNNAYITKPKLQTGMVSTIHGESWWCRVNPTTGNQVRVDRCHHFRDAIPALTDPASRSLRILRFLRFEPWGPPEGCFSWNLFGFCKFK